MLWIVGLTLIAVVLGGPAAAQCLTNQIVGCWINPGGSISTNAPTYSDGGHCGIYGGDASASYDLTAGKFVAYALGPLDMDSSGDIRAQDQYQLLGPLGPDSVSFEAHLQFGGGAAPGHRDSGPFGCCHSASMTALLAHGSSVQSAYVSTTGCCDGGSLATTLVLPLRKPVNQPFVLQMRLWAHAYWNATASGSATLSFVVPAGYAVNSCQGFTTGGVVATREHSWGQLKVLYR